MPSRPPASDTATASAGEHPSQMALRVSGRPQDADLPQPLLDAEPEEQHHQQQRRDDDEEAEVGEVLAEVGRAGRGVERERADGGDRDALRVGREPLLQVLLQRRRELARHPRRAPHRTEGRSRCRSVSPTVRAPARSGGTPWASCDGRPSTARPAGRTRDRSSGNGGSQSARLSACVMPGYSGARRRSAATPGHRHDARQREVCLRRAQAGGRVPQVELERDRIAGACAELASGPFVEHDRVCAGHDSQRRAKVRSRVSWGQTRV